MGFFGRIVNLGKGVVRGVGRSQLDKDREAALQAELQRDLPRRASAGRVSGAGGDPAPSDPGLQALAGLKKAYDDGHLTETEYLLKRAAVLDGHDPDDVEGSSGIERTL